MLLKKLLLGTALAVLAGQANAAITDCIIGVDTSAVFGEANFGSVNPLALPGSPVTANFTYFGRCTRTSALDPRRVQLRITYGTMSSSAGLTVAANYSTSLITLDWGGTETGTKQVNGTATYVLNGLTAQTTPGQRTFTQLTSTSLRTCSSTNGNNCTSYGAARLENAYVYLNVLKSCNIAPAALNFGSIVPQTNNSADATSSTSIACTNGTPYNVRVSGGTTTPGGQRTMHHGNGTDELHYQVYSDPARTVALSDSATVGATGAGSSQSFGLYGRVFTGQLPAAGNYTDTLTMTIEY